MRAMPWRAHLPVGTSASPVHAVHLPEEAAADCAAASSAVRIVAPDLPVLGVALSPVEGVKGGARVYGLLPEYWSTRNVGFVGSEREERRTNR